MESKLFINFNIIRKITLGSHVQENIKKIIEDYSGQVSIKDALVDANEIYAKLNNNIEVKIDLNKCEKQIIPVNIDSKEAEFILSMLYYLNKECDTSIKINVFTEAEKLPTLKDYNSIVVNSAKYIRDTFNINLVPIKVIDMEYALTNLNRYLLIPSDLLDSIISVKWDGYDIDFSVIPLNLDQIFLLLQKNAFLIPKIIDERNYKLFNLCAEDVSICEELEKKYHDTISFCADTRKRLKPKEGSLISPSDVVESLEKMLIEKKQITIKNIMGYFISKYNCKINQSKVIEKYEDKEFHYKDIVIDILSNINWIQFDEASKITQRDFIKDLIKYGYDKMQIKRKTIIFNEFTKIREFSDTSMARIDSNNNNVYGLVKTLSIFDNGEYLEKLIVPIETNPFQTFYKQVAMVKFKREFLKPFKSNLFKKVNELSINKFGDVIVKFKNNEERDNFINEFC